MNLFLHYQEIFLNLLDKLKDEGKISFPDTIKGLTVEIPPSSENADISCNAALILAKFNNKKPLEISSILKDYFLENISEIETIKVAGPGFLNINFKISFWESFIKDVIKLNLKYGSTKGNKKKYNIEFVSANPTGPLHVGHCRGAIFGDVLSNLLKFNGHDVTKEYYVNDYGNQIKTFALSVYYRILEISKNAKFPTDMNLYPGEYIIDIAKKIISKKDIKIDNLKNVESVLGKDSIKYSMQLIKENLIKLGVKHDNFVFETKLIEDNLVSKVVKILEKDKFVYTGKLKPPKGESFKNWKQRDQLLFNSSLFGDDQDRALQKEDKSWTYFASDIAYHAYKIDRNFDVLINVLGADHAGYIKRISAAVKAISHNKTSLVCKVSQLVKLYKKGKPFKMSKRKGDYITVDDLINEVGVDSVRFMMLNRSNDMELDFDFEKVTEKSKDNPVFYVQYAYARINSIFRLLKIDTNKPIDIKNEKFILNKYEIKILNKISEWPKCLTIATSKIEPHRIPFYLYDLVTLFHSYWNLGKENKDFRFIKNYKAANTSKLLLLKALLIVIKNGMNILGVSTPNKM